jgi:hypothetical protein
MNRDPLEQLLRDADANDASPALPPGLAQRVRGVAAHRARRARLAAGGVVAGCLAALVVWVIRTPVDPPITSRQIAQTTRSAPDARAELLAISQEADRRAAMAEAMWAAERRTARSSRRTLTPDVNAQVERAAFMMVYQAGRMPVAGGAKSPAADVYRQVSHAFPDTPSAQVARQRLSELTNRKDG